MIATIGTKDFELKTNIRTIRKIETAFNHKPFLKIVENFEELKIDEVIKFLMNGIDDKEQATEFKNEIEENVGMIELFEILKDFVGQIQYPGKTKEEIKKLMDAQAKEMEK